MNKNVNPQELMNKLFDNIRQKQASSCPCCEAISRLNGLINSTNAKAQAYARGEITLKEWQPILDDINKWKDGIAKIRALHQYDVNFIMSDMPQIKVERRPNG